MLRGERKRESCWDSCLLLKGQHNKERFPKGFGGNQAEKLPRVGKLELYHIERGVKWGVKGVKTVSQRVEKE